MRDLAKNSFNIIGGVIFLFVGLVYMFLRLIKAWGITWLGGVVTGKDLGGLFGAMRFGIYMAALVYLLIAVIGFMASSRRQLRPIVLGIGVVFTIFGLIALFKGAGLLAILKLIAGILYVLYGLVRD